MAKSMAKKVYRSLKRRAHRAKRSYDDTRAAVHTALTERTWVRWTLIVVLVLLTATSLVSMARLNGAAQPDRDMKWFLRQNELQIAAPPAGAVETGTTGALPAQDGGAQRASAGESASLAGVFRFLLFTARAEEALRTEPPLAPAEDPAEAEDLFADFRLENAYDGSGADASRDDAEPDPESGLEEDAALEGLEEEERFVFAGDLMEEAPENAVLVTISAVGDCTLGGDAPHGGDKDFDKYVKKYGYDYFFSRVRSVFEADDLTIVNLEGPLTRQTRPRVRKQFTFRGKPEYVQILSSSSVEICNVANNHALDYNKAGLKETVAALDAVGIGSCGFGKICDTEVRGVKVRAMGFTRWQYSAKDVYTDVKKAREGCDLLIVCIHWGDEGKYTASEEQKRMGRAAIEAGADVVLGSHPHVFGGIEKYKGKYIVYSLGNFCFGGNHNPSDKRTLIFRQRFVVTDGAVEDAGIDIVPAAVTLRRGGNDYQPAIMPMDRAKLLLKNIAKVSSVKMSEIQWLPDGWLAMKGLVSP